MQRGRAVGQALTRVSLPNPVRREGQVARKRTRGPRGLGTEKEKVEWGWGSMRFSVPLEVT